MYWVQNDQVDIFYYVWWNNDVVHNTKWNSRDIVFVMFVLESANFNAGVH